MGSFDLTVTSDCAYGFTDIIKQKAILNKTSPFFDFRIQSDLNTYILPRIRIKTTGNFQISNTNDPNHPKTELQNLPSDQIFEFVMDSDTDTIFIQTDDTTVPLPDPNMFNWHFLRLVDGPNKIMLHTKTENSEAKATETKPKATKAEDVEVEIEIQYREPRRIIV